MLEHAIHARIALQEHIFLDVLGKQKAAVNLALACVLTVRTLPVVAC